MLAIAELLAGGRFKIARFRPSTKSVGGLFICVKPENQKEEGMQMSNIKA
jgi:hypothetical protein